MENIKHKALSKRITQPVKHRMMKSVKNLESMREKKTHERLEKDYG